MRSNRRRRALGALLAVAGTAVWAPAHAAPDDPGRLSSTWLPYWNTEDAYARVVANADLFHTVSPFWYQTTTCTGITAHPGAGSAAVVDGLHEHGIAVVPTITSTMRPAATLDCLGDPGQRSAHVSRVLEVARAGAYDGLEFNYEHLAVTTDAGTADRVRGAYSAFAGQVCEALHAAGKTCVHTVMPRTDDSFSVWRGTLMPAVYDYAAIGAVADRVRVMAYDQHAGRFGPGPIAGYPWMEAVAAYTRAKVPAGKAELGIPLYGRDWASGSASTVTDPAAVALARQHGVPVVWDDAQRAPRFSYAAGDVQHTVWFSDARAVTERVSLARAAGLGPAFWVPGHEDAATWGPVREHSRARFHDTVGGEQQRAVEAVAAAGIALGVEGGGFRPAAPVTRGQMASFLARALGLPPGGAPPFADATSSAHAAAIASVAEAGIAAGHPDGTYAPDAPVSRGQMATFLQRGFGLEPCAERSFSDVTASPHEPGVCAVSTAGIASGFPDGTFRPGAAVTRGQMALFLSRALAV